jgi:DNA-binding LytR/AlgR family response regulator
VNGAASASLRVLVVDDEPPALDELTFLLGKDDRVAEVRGCLSATDALQVLHSTRVDAVFLDVAMPGLTGLELATVLGRFKEPPAIVFVTAHEEHAVDAFELNAVDYLLKPVREERLREAVRRLCDAGGVGDPEHLIPVELGGITRFVLRSEVRYVAAQGDYVRLHTADDSHLLRVSLSALEERWQEAGFLRIHRSLLVSLAHVDEVRVVDGRCAVVVDGVELQASRRLSPAVREMLRRHPRGDT